MTYISYNNILLNRSGIEKTTIKMKIHRNKIQLIRHQKKIATHQIHTQIIQDRQLERR